MRTIWKFPLPGVLASPAVIEMPRDAQVRRLAVQDGQPTIWAEVDSEQPLESRTFVTVGTGHPWETAGAYIGSYEQGPFVWHVYEPLEVAIPAELRPMLPDFRAQNAYRLLVKEGFTLRDDKAWQSPDGEPLSYELMLAVAELQEHGFGPVV